MVGLGPGGLEHLTPAAKEALQRVDSVVGYGPYVEQVGSLVQGKNLVTMDLGQELERAAKAVELAYSGHQVAVDTMLSSFGWQDDDADLYPTFWALRSQPRAFEVKGDFPAMTPDLVGPVVPNFALLSEVSYRVDLTDLHYDALPDPISGFVES